LKAEYKYTKRHSTTKHKKKVKAQLKLEHEYTKMEHKRTSFRSTKKIIETYQHEV
jgi:hypothetical protein